MNPENGMQVQIRELTEKDDPAVERIIRSCLVEFGADHPGTAWEDPFLGRLSRVYTGPSQRYWVALDASGQIVGGVGIGALPGCPELCELQKMYCLPRARATGAAHRLMQTALAFARAHYRGCYLETLENMKAAQRFYEKNGFERVDAPPVKTAHFACDVRYLKRF